VTFAPPTYPRPMTDHGTDRGRAQIPPATRHRRLLAVLTATPVLLAAVAAVHAFGPRHAGMVAGPLAAGILVALARHAGLSWYDLGLSRRAWRRGAVYAVAAAALVGAVYAAAAALPATRVAFLDSRYHLPPLTALATAFVAIPVGTVLLEEVAFRGVILALVREHRGGLWATGISAALFGLWHVMPSLNLNRVNPAIGSVVGHGVLGQVAAVAASVAFTGGAGLLLNELRRRSGSLLASAGLHWATNGLAVVVATVLWQKF
jgi:uncharacterized protein